MKREEEFGVINEKQLKKVYKKKINRTEMEKCVVKQKKIGKGKKEREKERGRK